MVVASGTAALIGAGVSAASSAYGAHKQAKAQGKAQSAQAAQYQEAMGYMRDGSVQMQAGYQQMVPHLQEYAKFAQGEPERIADSLRYAEESLVSGGLDAKRSLELAGMAREGSLSKSLGHLSMAMDVNVREQEKARLARSAAYTASGATGTAGAAAEAQAMGVEADALARASLGVGQAAAGLTETAGRDIMGLNQASAGYDFSTGQSIAQQRMTGAGWLSAAREGAASANRSIGELALAKNQDLANWKSQMAQMAMGVQHKGPQGPNAWQQAGESLGGLDWGAMLGGGSPGSGLSPQENAWYGANQGNLATMGANTALATMGMPGFNYGQ